VKYELPTERSGVSGVSAGAAASSAASTVGAAGAASFVCAAVVAETSRQNSALTQGRRLKSTERDIGSVVVSGF
jgi:hypothetical protein